MNFDFEAFRRQNGSIDLIAAFHHYLSLLPANSPKRIVSAPALDLMRMLEQTHPIRSTEVAALALAQAMML